YKINFIDIREPGALELLHTDVKQVFEFIRDAKDEEKWQEHMRKNPVLDISALEVIAEFTNTKQLKDLNENYGQGGVIHMCKAWDDHFESGIRKGRVEGKVEGEQRMADLISKLYTDGKMEIVPEIVTNLELRNQYYAQYSL
ncbi:MAG: hypothetical protein IJ471_08470, partial [Eubacterium sp.]|nr:hypothetical protein [Eubacterium sp.]